MTSQANGQSHFNPATNSQASATIVPATAIENENYYSRIAVPPTISSQAQNGVGSVTPERVSCQVNSVHEVVNGDQETATNEEVKGIFGF